jgi:hypothetical protein
MSVSGVSNNGVHFCGGNFAPTSTGNQASNVTTTWYCKKNEKRDIIIFTTTDEGNENNLQSMNSSNESNIEFSEIMLKCGMRRNANFSAEDIAAMQFYAKASEVNGSKEEFKKLQQGKIIEFLQKLKKSNLAESKSFGFFVQHISEKSPGEMINSNFSVFVYNDSEDKLKNYITSKIREIPCNGAIQINYYNDVVETVKFGDTNKENLKNKCQIAKDIREFFWKSAGVLLLGLMTAISTTGIGIIPIALIAVIGCCILIGLVAHIYYAHISKGGNLGSSPIMINVSQ